MTLPPCLKHSVIVGRLLGDGLKDIPMLNDFPLLIEPKNIDPGPIFITWPLLVTVQDHVVSFGNSALEVHTLARILLCHPYEVRDERLFTVGDTRVMLDIFVPCEAIDRFGRLIL